MTSLEPLHWPDVDLKAHLHVGKYIARKLVPWCSEVQESSSEPGCGSPLSGNKSSLLGSSHAAVGV